MSFRLARRQRLVLAVMVMAVLAALLSGSSQAGTASAATIPSAKAGHVMTSLPGCAVTSGPKVGSNSGRVCLMTIAQLEKATGSVVKPASVITDGCFFRFYQNGPYGSAAWANGWWHCVNAVAENGDYYVPSWLNDQASAWDSCTDGYFYANQPGTSPGYPFPAGTHGNFPLGPVPNDSLSSAIVYYRDFIRSC